MKRFTKTQSPPLGKVQGMAKPNPKPRKTPAAAPHAFKGLRDWIEVFRTGAHTDSQGKQASFTAADLDQMAANVVGAGVPAVVGHPKETDPAYAWARDVKRDGDRLLVKLSDINPDFEAAVDGGAYRERSLSIFKDAARGWVVQHIGWLGGAAPAITGMQPLAYAAAPADAERHTFAMAAGMDTGYALSNVATLLRNLREWVISKDGLDAANQALPDWAIGSVADAATRINAEAMEDDADEADDTATPLFTRRTGDPTMTTFTQAQVDAARAEAAAQATAQFSAQGMELAELRAERQLERIGVQVNGWKAAGLVTPAEEPGLVQFMAALDGDQADVFKFTAADKSAVEQTPARWFAQFMASRKPVIKLGAVQAGDETDPGAGSAALSDKAVADKAHAFRAKRAAEGYQISIATAIDAVTAGQAGT